MGALLITAFNLFTIVYKMFFAPESDDDEASECEYGILEVKEDGCIELKEDFMHN